MYIVDKIAVFVRYVKKIGDKSRRILARYSFIDLSFVGRIWNVIYLDIHDKRFTFGKFIW